MQRSTWSRTLAHAAVLVGLGLVVGVANNLTAGKTRRLDWVTDYPDLPKGGSLPVAQPADGAGTDPAGTVTPAHAPPAPATGGVPAGDEDLSAVVLPQVEPGKPSADVTGIQARKAYKDGALFVDARRTANYEEGHVAGAVSLSVWEAGVDDKVNQLAFELEGDTTRPVVVYCSGGDCVDSHSLAERLWAAGYTNVLVYKDGYPDWTAHGWETRTGADR